MIARITVTDEDGIEKNLNRQDIILEALYAYEGSLIAHPDFLTNPSHLSRRMFVRQIINQMTQD